MIPSDNMFLLNNDQIDNRFNHFSEHHSVNLFSHVHSFDSQKLRRSFSCHTQ